MRVIIFIFLIYSQLAFSEFTPRSLLKSYFSLPPDAPNISNITHSDYLEIMNAAKEIYFTEAATQGKVLEFNDNWENPYFNASAMLIAPMLYEIVVWGGLVRMPEMTHDTLTLVICHELGHVLGGEPLQNIPNSNWASCEGQSDYFSTNKCLTRMLQKLPLKEDLVKIPRPFPTWCKIGAQSDKDVELCLRGVSAIEKFGLIIKKINDENKTPSVSRNDSHEVDETIINSYPSTQCRVDTYLAGFFHKPRPACWYKME